MSEPRYVNLRWLDAWSDPVDDVSIEKAKEKHKPLEMETRGWLLVDDETGVSIFCERTADQESYRGRTFVPRGMVKSIEDFPKRRKPSTRKSAQGSSRKIARSVEKPTASVDATVSIPGVVSTPTDATTASPEIPEPTRKGMK